MIQKQNLIKGGVYKIHSRNLDIGVWNGDEGFVGIREKFGERYLFTEYLARQYGGTNIGFDTVTPIEKIDSIPLDIEVKDQFWIGHVPKDNDALFEFLDKLNKP